MEIRICDKCRSVNIKKLLPIIKKLFPNANVILGCQNMCGIGRNNPFLIVDDKPIISSSNDELIKKIQDIVK